MEANINMPELFEKKEDCCACGACLNICKNQAITMKEDEYGYVYPVIDYKKCSNCGMCKRVCMFQKERKLNSPLETYAAVSKDNNLRMNSSSGGIFASLATFILEKGGIVCGAAFSNDLKVNHLIIEEKSQIYKLQGSKYVQSNIKNTFTDVRRFLLQGKVVLYSGTPCQIDGLYGFLQKEYKNLITIDIICHGVPNNRMFLEYIKEIEKDKDQTIKQFNFRDKSLGWGINGSAMVKKKK